MFIYPTYDHEQKNQNKYIKCILICHKSDTHEHKLNDV